MRMVVDNLIQHGESEFLKFVKQSNSSDKQQSTWCFTPLDEDSKNDNQFIIEMPYGEKRPRLVAWQSKKLTMNSNSSKLSMDYNSQRPLVTTLEDDGYSETKKIVCKIFVKNE